MKEITENLVEKSKVILEQPESIQNFNQFCINYYNLTKHLLSSFNAFLNANDINNTKLTQIKNIGNFLETSKDSIKVHKFLEDKGYEQIPELKPKIAYYTYKKNKYTLLENWENIIRVLEGEKPATFVLEENNLTEKQKSQVIKKASNILKLERREVEFIKNSLQKLKDNDKKLFELFVDMIDE